ncbi:MAG: enoyl-CoA hydratase-related protein [Pseudomonas sp.]|jgi:enoyl-CoA hydratase/carnithine racemase|uniref:enoyl-CoA hydratase-related protein n=1 Tax=Pseudomonas sp. TaxID=306 RepID=UPI0023936F89|nr:enoyl-CoA hydratase-related protein [Pseudomonas sp.]MDE1198865.1 enoyl-CoA hydratase-related protein [Pseudomonas sp.]
MKPTVLIERQDSVAIVTLHNPEKMNALTLSMWQDLRDVMSELSSDLNLRCVVLRGAGEQAFAAGADVGEFPNVRANADQARRYADVTNAAMRAVAECPHPVIAMIHGVCVGGGLEIAALCDLRICGQSSRFGAPVGKLGLVMSYDEMAGLVALAGRSTTLEILLEGRILDAADAYVKHLVTRVVADDQVQSETLATARRICAGAPLVARWHRQAARQLEAGQAPTAEQIDNSYFCYDSEDFQIGLGAFIEKARPQFKGK